MCFIVLYHNINVDWLFHNNYFVISAQLPFQMLSSSKSPSSADNVPNKKKRKIASPLVGSKSPKVVKLATKENSVRNVPERTENDASETKLNSSNDSVEIILDDGKKDLEQSDSPKIRKDDNTPKKKSLGKNKKLDGSQQKPGALTKFFKRAEREVEENDISRDLSELKDKKDCQDMSAQKKKNEICSNESADARFIRSELQDTSGLSETEDQIVNKDADCSLQESDCDITLLSSDEAASELDKSISSINQETTDKPATPVTPKIDKAKKTKSLTPKQLEKKREIARKKEEKQKLKLVRIVHRRDLNFIFLYKINLLNYKFDYIVHPTYIISFTFYFLCVRRKKKNGRRRERIGEGREKRSRRKRKKKKK